MSKRSAVALVVLALSILSSSACIHAQSSTAADDQWASLRFLIGTWEAQTSGGTAAAKAIGVYSFALELNDHVLARHSGGVSCKAPSDFNCEHSDLLYLYREGGVIKAIYLDNEGHTIHYGVTTPNSASAVFLSDPAIPGPQFRLEYERKDVTLSGKFQMKMPGQDEFKSYLEWSGHRK
jgi:hypothetical protein